MSKKILISVIMPIYNAEEYLHDSIGSILNQNMDNYELILINDGSTDGSLKVIKEYEKKYKNVRVLSRENKGILKTRLEGIEKARGEYIVFLDADDILPLGTLQKYETIINDGQYDIIKGNLERLTNKGIIKSNVFTETFKISKEEFAQKIYLKFLTSSAFNNVCNSCIRKKLFDTNLDCKISMGDDQAIMLLLFQQANTILIIPDVVYQYRMNKASITNLKNIEKKCKNYDEIYYLYLKIIIPFFKKMKDSFLIKKSYSRYLRDLNVLFCEICQNTKNKKIIEKYQDKLFNDKLTQEARIELTKKDIKNQKTYIFIKPILENNKKKHLRNMIVLKLIKR